MVLHPHRQRNVLYLHGIPTIGGAERDLLTIVNGVRTVRPIVACPGHGPLVSLLKADGIPVVPVSLPPWRKWRSLPMIVPAIYRLFRTLISHRIDILHVNDLWWAPIGCYASRLAGIPCLIHVRGEYTTRHIRNYHLHQCKMCVPVSEAVVRSLMGAGIDRRCVRLVYSGVDVERIPPHPDIEEAKRRYGISPDRLVVGSVGNVLAVKGYEFLIRAIAEIKTSIPSILCVIVGDDKGQHGRKLKTLVNHLKLQRHVVFTGFVDDVFSIIAAMDVFALASVSEGFGIVLLEAMALSKPVVATMVGGIPEIVVSGETGLLVRARDPSALTSAIMRLLNHRADAQSMGERGRKRVEAHFSLHAEIAVLEDLYAELLDCAPAVG